jgi:hypothetical protein
MAVRRYRRYRCSATWQQAAGTTSTTALGSTRCPRPGLCETLSRDSYLERATWASGLYYLCLCRHRGSEAQSIGVPRELGAHRAEKVNHEAP